MKYTLQARYASEPNADGTIPIITFSLLDRVGREIDWRDVSQSGSTREIAARTAVTFHVCALLWQKQHGIQWRFTHRLFELEGESTW